MFSVDTTYYCGKCKKVQVKDWQFSFEEGGKALHKFNDVKHKNFSNDAVLTAFTSISWIRDDDEQAFPQIEPLMYCQKTIDTQVYGNDSVICNDEEMGYVYEEMHKMFFGNKKMVA
jgi:hypothetical protein